MLALIQFILEVLWLLLPAIGANVAPIFSTYYNMLPRLAIPLDGGLTWRGKRLLGHNKTIRGIVAGINIGVIIGLFQVFLHSQGIGLEISLLAYDSLVEAGLAGGMLGFGALAGDTVKSFFKRQLQIEPGASFIPWDQIDFIIGALSIASLLTTLTIEHVVAALLIMGVGSYVTSYLGVLFGIKKSL